MVRRRRDCAKCYLFAASNGLATVLRAWIDRSAIADALGLTHDQQVLVSQTVGYPKVRSGFGKGHRTLAEKVRISVLHLDRLPRRAFGLDASAGSVGAHPRQLVMCYMPNCWSVT